MFGRALTYTRYDWAYLDQGAMLGAEVFLDDLERRPDGTWVIARRLRIPR